MPWVWEEEEALEEHEEHWLVSATRRLAGDGCVHLVFGSLLQRNALTTTYCMIIVVALTIGIEGITHSIETVFKDSPFMPLVHGLPTPPWHTKGCSRQERTSALALLHRQ